ncbi:hypothetical protein C0389_10155 [bacterium]|nr:hypothetical protein [bacterium]
MLMCFFYRDLNCTSTIYDTNFMNLKSLQNNLLPNFVCRIAGFPVEFVENLSSQQISHSLQQLSELSKQSEIEKKRIFECIYKQISIETDQQKRNQLLKIKREVFNDNYLRKPIFQDFFIKDGYNDELSSYLNFQNEKVKKIEELKKEYSYFLIHSRHNFKKYLSDQDYQKGLLISSKQLFNSQNLYYKVPAEYLNKHIEQIERGLLRYFTRMAMKATPFGSFCAIVPGNITDSKSSDCNGKPLFFSRDPQIKTGIVLLNKNIFGILSQYIKSRQEIRKWLVLELNPTVVTENESLRYLTSLGGKEVFQRLQYNPAIEIIVEKLNANENVVFNELVGILSACEEIDSSREEVEQYLDKLIQIGFIHLKLDVPVKKRDWLIDEFANNPDTLVFLSTEAGGTGLNLQFADTVINFDLPWNLAKKSQRIGRINRIGQVSSKLTAVNMVALNSIEHNIANGIVVKKALFNAVLNNANLTDEVDFASKGRSTFIEQVQKMIQPVETSVISSEESPTETPEEIVNEVEDSGELIEEAAHREEKAANSNAEITTKQPVPEPQEIETTLNQGMQFLNGIFKMATGKELITEGKGITVNRETGEVTMKFKLPGF